MPSFLGRLTLPAAALLASCAPAPAPVAPPPVVPLATAASYIAGTPALATLARVAHAGGVDATLAGTGPFTVFAPTDAAFGRLAPGTVDALGKPENRAELTKLLTFHVVAGALTAADLAARVAAGGGSATLTSVEGDPLTLTMTQGHLTLSDADGNRSYVETGDLRQSNGIVHLVNGVLVPKLD